MHALVLLSISQHTKFEMLSLTHIRDMTGPHKLN